MQLGKAHRQGQGRLPLTETRNKSAVRGFSCESMMTRGPYRPGNKFHSTAVSPLGTEVETSLRVSIEILSGIQEVGLRGSDSLRFR